LPRDAGKSPIDAIGKTPEGSAMNEATAIADDVVVDLEALKKRCLGNLDLVERVLRKFNTQLDCDLTELERAVESHDTQSFAMVAHRIKGMSANVEARDLYRDAALAEQYALECCVEELPHHLQRIKAERVRIAESLPAMNVRAL
jgi:HPt (histidine-containing phosphotransfer) domain-containing protein